ncbi:3-carboxy-cis,cis-muconate cycloisomerase [Hymenobacter sp. BT491]|uniref:3-carboxy-cis,cis-muconate cycloisomerase n=1 Tax=Hymenobacter sp. BT491 TaxID=2766779 RepID=UPI00165378CC|nr:3-carboxy-cis,cis-muconate cycloisomerase [Hymenobacter sp. BT491]MBC6992007.1 3-carboxy-cis,cis-muconate cycloisomerase [Hymenobacter sp. BT491]
MAGLSHNIFTDKQIENLFSAETQVSYMLAFERALANAEGTLGVIPADAAEVIAAVCRETEWNPEALAEQTLLAGNPAIPLVKTLTQRVAQRDTEAAKYVHFGATSQDVLDTALMLQLQAATTYITHKNNELQNQLAKLASAHRDTVMIGRTLLQQARPITFGYKVAGWLEALLRAGQGLEFAQQNTFALQLGGAVGTLATLGEHGPAVVTHMAEALGLAAPLLPWHSQRDRLVDFAAKLGILCGNLGKMAQDLILLMQTEVGEVAEAAVPGKGGSSAMPHKRNPVSATFTVAIAGRTPALVGTLLAGLAHHEQERAAGAWHAEWEVLPELVRLTAAALNHANELISGLEVNAERMLRNLELTQGLIYAEDVTALLTPKLGKAEAHQLVEEASRRAQREGLHLRECLAQHFDIYKYLNANALEHVFDAHRATGLSQFFTDQVLARFHTSTSTT